MPLSIEESSIVQGGLECRNDNIITCFLSLLHQTGMHPSLKSHFAGNEPYTAPYSVEKACFNTLSKTSLAARTNLVL